MSKIAVFGLGYVGCVSGACLARDGHQDIGVDINVGKVEMLSEGTSPIAEAGIDELIRKQVAGGNYLLRMTISVLSTRRTLR